MDATPNSNKSWPSSIDCVMFKLGYLQATCDSILREVTAMRTVHTPKPSGDANWWTTAKEWLSSFVLLHKLWQALRSGPWGTLAWLGYAAAKWLGVL